MSFNKLDRIKLNYMFHDNKIIKDIFIPIIKQHISLFVFNNYDEFCTISSTLNMLSGVLVILVTQNDSIDSEKIVKCIDFVLMTALLDNYLDTNNLTNLQKIKRVKLLSDILYKNKAPQTKNPGIKYLYSTYLKYCDNAVFVDRVKKTFEIEIGTFRHQYSKKLSKNKLIKIAADKGSETIRLFKALIGLEIYPSDYDLGYIIQVGDDIGDIDEDRRSRINTVAIYVLDKEGTVDSLFHDIIFKFNSIKDDAQLAIKMIVFYFICYVGYNSPYISLNVKNIIKPYTFYVGKDRLEQIFGRIIYNILNKDGYVNF
jgi:hypothetical protein